MNAVDKIMASDALLSTNEGRIVIVNNVHTCELFVTATATEPTLILDGSKDIPMGNLYCCLCGLENVFEMDFGIKGSAGNWVNNCCVISPYGQKSTTVENHTLLNKGLDPITCESSLLSPTLTFCAVELFDDFGNKRLACKNMRRHAHYTDNWV